MRRPSSNAITLPFGSADPPYSLANRHKGTDFGHAPDITIYAPEAGQVRLVPNNGNDGNGVYMSVGDRFHGLLHTSKYLVANGQQVAEGQPVAIMGETGFAQGVHLHWALKVNNQFVDPMSYVTKEANMPTLVNDGITELIFVSVLHRHPVQADLDAWRGRNLVDFINELYHSQEWAGQDHYLKSPPPSQSTAQAFYYKVKSLLGGGSPPSA